MLPGTSQGKSYPSDGPVDPIGVSRSDRDNVISLDSTWWWDSVVCAWSPRPYVRVASISPVRESGVTRYELTEIWRGRLYPPDNSDKTKEKSISAQYITYNGEYLPNADGKRRSVISFATEALAITAAKTFLGITT